jgi:hypothetical protein
MHDDSVDLTARQIERANHSEGAQKAHELLQADYQNHAKAHAQNETEQYWQQASEKLSQDKVLPDLSVTWGVDNPLAESQSRAITAPLLADDGKLFKELAHGGDQIFRYDVQSMRMVDERYHFLAPEQRKTIDYLDNHWTDESVQRIMEDRFLKKWLVLPGDGTITTDSIAKSSGFSDATEQAQAKTNHNTNGSYVVADLARRFKDFSKFLSMLSGVDC